MEKQAMESIFSIKTATVITILSLLLGIVSCAHKATIENSAAAEYNIQLGLAYLGQGDKVRAKAKLSQALNQAPLTPQPYTAMAYYLEEIGELEQAEYYYQQALKHAPADAQTHNHYAIFLCKQQRYAAAHAHFQQALATPNDFNMTDAYENAGLCAWYAGELIRAENYLNLALQRDSSRIKAKLALTQIDEQRDNCYNQSLIKAEYGE